MGGVKGGIKGCIKGGVKGDNSCCKWKKGSK